MLLLLLLCCAVLCCAGCAGLLLIMRARRAHVSVGPVQSDPVRRASGSGPGCLVLDGLCPPPSPTSLEQLALVCGLPPRQGSSRSLHVAAR
jgi:uncharacterized iron-regulated membrane protein